MDQNEEKVVWIVGTVQREHRGAMGWNFRGVYSSESRAQEVAEYGDFIAPIAMNFDPPREATRWPGAYNYGFDRPPAGKASE